MKLTLVATCMFGLEKQVGEEIDALGLHRLETMDGRVTFEGEEAPAPAPITKSDLLDKHLIGPDSAARRADLQRRLGLPARLTANGLLEALTLLLTREEFDAL